MSWATTPTAWLAAGWAATAITAAAVLGVSGAVAGRWPEEAHVVGHLGLCAVLSVLLAESLARRARPAAALTAALALTLAFGAAIEAVQLRWSPGWNEVLHDLATDGIGAVLGAVARAHLRPARRVAVGHVLSAVLHPLWIAPAGLAAALYAADRSGGTALRWTAVAAICLAPAVAAWLAGVARGVWSDADLSRRTDRPLPYALGCAGTLAFAAAAAHGPPPVGALAALCAGGAVLGAAITGAGLKVSGHVAIPAALGLAAVPWSDRAPWLLLGVAAALSWARIAAGRHRPVEVAAAWGLALAVALAAVSLR